MAVTESRLRPRGRGCGPGLISFPRAGGFGPLPQVFTLAEQLNLALARRYAASGEILSPDQVNLFDGAEIDSDTEFVAEASTSVETDDEIMVAAHTRKKRVRKALPDHLPRIDVIYGV